MNRKKTDKPQPQQDPSRVYAYGARCTDPRAFEILRKAHQYRNRLCEIELDRRRACDELMRSTVPEIATAMVASTQAAAKVEAVIAEAKSWRQKARSKKDADQWGPVISAARSDERTAQQVLSKLRKAWFSAHKKDLATIDESSHAARIDARANCGIFWGTYLQVEDAAKDFGKGAPPRFARWEGEGRIAVQIQLGGTMGVGKCDTNIQVDEAPAGSDHHETSKNPWRNGRIRIGSDEARKPVWLPFLVKLHRPIPETARIKWAWLCARRIGLDTKWSLQFVLQDKWIPVRASTGIVALDLGWKQKADGIQVAHWLGDDGDEGDIVIPNEQINRNAKCLDLQSIRDKHMDELKAAIVSLTSVPEWIAERLKGCHQWRSAARFASVAIAIRENRTKGDEAIAMLLEQWRKQDKHLLSWQSHQRQGLSYWRQNHYRTAVAQFAERYHTAVIEDIDWRKFACEKPVGEDDGKHEPPDEARRLAAVSILTLALKNRLEVATVKAADTNSTCGMCQEPITNGVCAGCGTVADRGRNACLNMLRRHWENLGDEVASSRFFRGQAVTSLRKMGGVQ